MGRQIEPKHSMKANRKSQGFLILVIILTNIKMIPLSFKLKKSDSRAPTAREHAHDDDNNSFGRSERKSTQDDKFAIRSSGAPEQRPAMKYFSKNKPHPDKNDAKSIKKRNGEFPAHTSTNDADVPTTTRSTSSSGHPTTPSSPSFQKRLDRDAKAVFSTKGGIDAENFPRTTSKTEQDGQEQHKLTPSSNTVVVKNFRVSDSESPLQPCLCCSVNTSTFYACIMSHGYFACDGCHDDTVLQFRNDPYHFHETKNHTILTPPSKSQIAFQEKLGEKLGELLDPAKWCFACLKANHSSQSSLPLGYNTAGKNSPNFSSSATCIPKNPGTDPMTTSEKMSTMHNRCSKLPHEPSLSCEIYHSYSTIAAAHGDAPPITSTSVATTSQPIVSTVEVDVDAYSNSNPTTTSVRAHEWHAGTSSTAASMLKAWVPASRGPMYRGRYQKAFEYNGKKNPSVAQVLEKFQAAALSTIRNSRSGRTRKNYEQYIEGLELDMMQVRLIRSVKDDIPLMTAEVTKFCKHQQEQRESSLLQATAKNKLEDQIQKRCKSSLIKNREMNGKKNKNSRVRNGATSCDGNCCCSAH